LEALEQSRLDATTHARLAALARDFAGRRATAARVKQRQKEAQERGDFAKAEQLLPEYERLTQDDAWAARYGEAWLRLLQEREATLVDLHQTLQRLELRRSPRAG
jgi:hypothetical protein